MAGACAVGVRVAAAWSVAIWAEKVSKADVKMASGAMVGSALPAPHALRIKAVTSVEISVSVRSVDRFGVCISIQ